MVTDPLRQNDPDQNEFTSLITHFRVEQTILLRKTATHQVHRLICHADQYILKWFHSPAQAIEPKIYAILRGYNIPTLPVYAQTEHALVLEDLQSSPTWRLADPLDLSHGETGMALADWYRSLHAAGRKALKDPLWLQLGVHPWVAAITPSSLDKAGAAFKLENEPAWKAAVEHAPALVTKYLAMPQTFNYNDFAAENLALSRLGGRSLRAIVFDYDCFATGVAYSDWRNVMFSLDGEAQEAFREGYGTLSDIEGILDQPLDTLYGLVVASQRNSTPRWVLPLVESVTNGIFQRQVKAALEITGQG